MNMLFRLLFPFRVLFSSSRQPWRGGIMHDKLLPPSLPSIGTKIRFDDALQSPTDTHVSNPEANGYFSFPFRR